MNRKVFYCAAVTILLNPGCVLDGSGGSGGVLAGDSGSGTERDCRDGTYDDGIFLNQTDTGGFTPKCKQLQFRIPPESSAPPFYQLAVVGPNTLGPSGGYVGGELVIHWECSAANLPEEIEECRGNEMPIVGKTYSANGGIFHPINVLFTPPNQVGSGHPVTSTSTVKYLKLPTQESKTIEVEFNLQSGSLLTNFSISGTLEAGGESPASNTN